MSEKTEEILIYLSIIYFHHTSVLYRLLHSKYKLPLHNLLLSSCVLRSEVMAGSLQYSSLMSRVELNPTERLLLGAASSTAAVSSCRGWVQTSSSWQLLTSLLLTTATSDLLRRATPASRLTWAGAASQVSRMPGASVLTGARLTLVTRDPVLAERHVAPCTCPHRRGWRKAE